MSVANTLDRDCAARWDLDSAHGHLDTVACLLDDAVAHLDGARETRVVEILDHVSAVLAELDRLRATL